MIQFFFVFRLVQAGIFLCVSGCVMFIIKKDPTDDVDIETGGDGVGGDNMVELSASPQTNFDDTTNKASAMPLVPPSSIMAGSRVYG